MQSPTKNVQNLSENCITWPWSLGARASAWNNPLGSKIGQTNTKNNGNHLTSDTVEWNFVSHNNS